MNLSATHQEQLNNFWQYCLEHQYFNIGYPESADFDYSHLFKFLKFSLNNCGDWREPSNYALNSFDFERDVLNYFSELFHIDSEDSWGYVTNGGTEGNMFGCYIARELFPNSTLYYSKETHYSVAKIVKLLRMKSCLIETTATGEIDIDDLTTKIKLNQEKQPIIFANIGTTMSGAIDNIDEIQIRLKQIGIDRNDFYLHADAALSGMILPFVSSPQPFSFADGIDSISVSGHKMIGSPIPCGIVVARRKDVERISVDIDYISAKDQTISGSRNGHSVLMMWAAIQSKSASDWRHSIEHCLSLAQYAVERLQAENIPAWRNPNSVTVVFPRPSENVWRKFHLAISGNKAHLITMPHNKDTKKLDQLIDAIILDQTTLPQCSTYV
ncbi:histidine decarboxylase [Marinomonas mediterranea]|uniref:Histidine decarboxylase n=1 Tax=Marinomonas mediterranea (strain ATCC 700492 / JCM 21426 / NBRC 103028 / MMB-1) TaxID=717774 RepID=F2JYD6_MARM1|nr:histidine decarboxylase [Marinomonas mediterranea]ADZ91967.1 Histidine decarboxylase [Marinomonas mediterranea MMB-1]WCN18047.1 histidine decarboxylase [Marinomonas mediterranea MMB-1]